MGIWTESTAWMAKGCPEFVFTLDEAYLSSSTSQVPTPSVSRMEESHCSLSLPCNQQEAVCCGFCLRDSLSWWWEGGCGGRGFHLRRGQGQRLLLSPCVFCGPLPPQGSGVADSSVSLPVTWGAGKPTIKKKNHNPFLSSESQQARIYNHRVDDKWASVCSSVTQV